VQSRAGFVRIDSNLGALALKRGRLERARSHFENARSTARATGDVLNQARIDINVGVAAMQHGDLEAAREAFYEARDIAGEIGWKEGLERLAPRIEELHLALE
jgi:tetratricopeptide (TPR) repeat protein